MLGADRSAESEIRHIGDIVALGQSVWFDNIRRGLLTSGEFERMALEDVAADDAEQEPQARGDFDALAGRGRRALRIDLGADATNGLSALRNAIERVLP